MSRIEERFGRVKERLEEACSKAGRDVSEVTVIAVTKYAQLADIKELIGLGCRDFGESKAQHLKDISSEIDEYLNSDPVGLGGNIKWHMIGHLQRNKVRQVLPLCSIIHSVDSLRLAEEISGVSQKLGIISNILLQVNVSKEEQKFGIPVGAITHLCEQIVTMRGVNVCGLMTMAPYTDDKDLIRWCFGRARELFEEVKQEHICGNEFRHLSMGMSSDFEIAVEEGASMVRVGSAIFGE